jgi:hypothetical protein
VNNIKGRGSSTELLVPHGPVLPSGVVVKCDGYNISMSDFQCAESGFDAYLDQGTDWPNGERVWADCGSAMAYMCVFADNKRGWGSEFNQAAKLIDVLCGTGGAGWVDIPTASKSYGRANSGTSFC